MKHLYALFIGVLLTLIAMPAEAQRSQPEKVLRHVVLFKFKDSASAVDIRNVEEAFASLTTKIKLIKAFEWGINNSPEGLNQDLTHCFLVTFKSEKDRDEYLIHPEHQAFVEILRPHLEKATVVDYWTETP